MSPASTKNSFKRSTSNSKNTSGRSTCSSGSRTAPSSLEGLGTSSSIHPNSSEYTYRNSWRSLVGSCVRRHLMESFFSVFIFWCFSFLSFKSFHILWNQNYRRWGFLFGFFLLSILTLEPSLVHTFILFLFLVIFEIILLNSRKLRHLRNSTPVLFLLVSLLLQVLLVLLLHYAPHRHFSHFFFEPAPLHLIKIAPVLAPPTVIGRNTIDRSAVYVKQGEALRVPFSREMDATLRNVVGPLLNNPDEVAESYMTGDDVSIIIPVRDEHEYLSKTIMYTVQQTPKDSLKEFIVVDDASKIPIAEILDTELPRNIRGLVKVLRYDDKQGLIRARIRGADLSTSTNIFFLDGHCRPKAGWLAPLIRHLKTNYKRIACPVIMDIAAATWEETGTSGFKMMFEWNFEFAWYDDLTDEVPVSAGGILAMTKKWWEESGKYDSGMLEWGGENIEQSIRVWLCGGEIYVVRNSQIGHIFDRPAKPNPGNKLVTQVQKNQKRAALVWLDDYYQYFEKHHPVVTELDEGKGLEERMALRRAMNCMPFQWYVDRFRVAFERKGLLDDEFYHIQHSKSRWCLSVMGPSPLADEDEPNKKHHHLMLMPCQRSSTNQQWLHVGGNRLMYHRQTGKCIDAFGAQERSPDNDSFPIIYECDWNGVFQLANYNQFWQFDHTVTHRIFRYPSQEIATLTGHDIFSIQRDKVDDPGTVCLQADLEDWNAWDWTKDDEEFKAQSRLSRDVYYRRCQKVEYDWNDPQHFQPLW